MTIQELEQCILLYGKDIYSFCMHLAKEKESADDLYQDAFLEATKKIASIVKKAKETQNMKHRTLKSGVAVAAAIGILVVGSASAYAAYRYLTPSQVADQMTEYGALAKAFESKDAITINETQKSAGYEITLMGIVTGKDLSVVVNDENRSVISTKKLMLSQQLQKRMGHQCPDRWMTVTRRFAFRH